MFATTIAAALANNRCPFEPARFVFDAMVAGNTPAEAFVDDPESPSVALIWDTGHCCYLGGEPGREEHYPKAATFFRERVLRSLREKGQQTMKIHCSSDRWRDALLQTLVDYGPTIRWRTLYRHDLRRLPGPPIRAAAVVRAIDGDVLDGHSFENASLLVDEIVGMWGDAGRFLEAGFGYCAIEGRTLVGWCTAEHVSQRSCGIGIETIETHQNRGIATALATAMLQACARADISPHWDSWKSNLPSVRVAGKLGFDPVQDYQVLFIH